MNGAVYYSEIAPYMFCTETMFADIFHFHTVHTTMLPMGVASGNLWGDGSDALITGVGQPGSVNPATGTWGCLYTLKSLVNYMGLVCTGLFSYTWVSPAGAGNPAAVGIFFSDLRVRVWLCVMNGSLFTYIRLF